ncbi:hypothetical protein MNEG_5476 [Monoraphidium neglectum]|uniref:Uncharacterized protein n=1 Tax=Monoraphidium neglectum TaxID=145388 RepID=A0A0D2NA73_9CHLO|nr:hypothetical protein MNEG_5476 [Monoraphidium neglectum]KIZ02481.1 hypothetical protein MNEG_5476 [Monoraphidium neglectum]|eukprot:XP_013901500.1 hypothetical protein MNEG_5476 [Monoraphidium neglectum]
MRRTRKQGEVTKLIGKLERLVVGKQQELAQQHVIQGDLQLRAEVAQILVRQAHALMSAGEALRRRAGPGGGGATGGATASAAGPGAGLVEHEEAYGGAKGSGASRSPRGASGGGGALFAPAPTAGAACSAEPHASVAEAPPIWRVQLLDMLRDLGSAADEGDASPHDVALGDDDSGSESIAGGGGSEGENTGRDGGTGGAGGGARAAAAVDADDAAVLQAGADSSVASVGAESADESADASGPGLGGRQRDPGSPQRPQPGGGDADRPAAGGHDRAEALSAPQPPPPRVRVGLGWSPEGMLAVAPSVDGRLTTQGYRERLREYTQCCCILLP